MLLTHSVVELKPITDEVYFSKPIAKKDYDAYNTNM